MEHLRKQAIKQDRLLKKDIWDVATAQAETNQGLKKEHYMKWGDPYGEK